MAIEDGVMLARCLRDHLLIPSAFEAYERLRRDRVERIVAAGARMSSNKTPGPIGRFVRDVMLKLILRFVVTEKSVAWMHDYRIDWATGATAPTHMKREKAAA